VALLSPRWLDGGDAAVCWWRTGQEGIHLVCVSPWEVPSTDCVAFCSCQKVTREPRGAAASAAGPLRRYVPHITSLIYQPLSAGKSSPVARRLCFHAHLGYTSGCLPCLPASLLGIYSHLEMQPHLFGAVLFPREATLMAQRRLLWEVGLRDGNTVSRTLCSRS